MIFFFFFSSRRRHTRLQGDWSSDVCSSDLAVEAAAVDRLQPVADVRQRAADDDRHRIIEVRPADLVLDRDGDFLFGGQEVRAHRFGSRGLWLAFKYPDSSRSTRSFR